MTEGDERVVVKVADRGPGFPDHMCETAFDEFTRGDPSRTRRTGGAGCGLAIARGLVHAHGGEIAIDPGPGGVVSFWLPASPSHTSMGSSGKER